MKNVIVAEDQGFCWGVRRALDIVEKYNRVFIFGDLIHNKQVVRQLENNGKKIIHEISGSEDRPIVITAHGTTLSNFEKIKSFNLECVDTTCPLVSTIYKAGKRLEKEGYQIVIIGDENHVEVKGIASRLDRPVIVNDEKQLEHTRLPEKVGVICQSTFSEIKFEKIARNIRGKVNEIKIRNTTCSPTKKRQTAAEKLARQVDIIVVVGGHHSSNTKKLAELTSKYAESYHVETSDQLKENWFEGKKEIGIVSGASTADWIVEDICQKIRSFD